MLLKRAGNANTIRKVLLEPTMIEQAATTLAIVSQETAGQLLRKCLLSPGEQEATWHQVTLLLEVASTADESAMRRRRFLRSPGIIDMQTYAERLIWLAFIYQILGHNAKAENRARRARETFPEIKNLMAWDVDSIALCPGSRTEQYAPFSRIAAYLPARR